MNVMKAEPGTLRKMNERRVMNTIRIHGALSRTDIQRELNLALPTVSRIVDALIELNMVEEIGILETSMGRPPIMVRINPGGAHAIGVDVGRKMTRLVYVNLLGERTHEAHFPTEYVDTPEKLVHFLGESINEQGASLRVIGIGIAAPGSTNPHPTTPRGDMDERPDHHWHHEPLIGMIRSKLNVPAWIENDANAAVLGEMWFGVGQSAQHLVFVLADEGLGAGIALNGSIYHGENNEGGEFAHTIVDIRSDEICECNRRGCLGGIAPTPNVLQAVQRAKGVWPSSLGEVVTLAKAGVEPEASVISRTLDYLAVGIMNLVHILDPTMIVFGGSTFLLDDFVFEQTAQRLQDLLFPRVLPIVKTKFGPDAVAIGAATLALQQVYDHTQLIDDPLYVRL